MIGKMLQDTKPICPGNSCPLEWPKDAPPTELCHVRFTEAGVDNGTPYLSYMKCSDLSAQPPAKKANVTAAPVALVDATKDCSRENRKSEVSLNLAAAGHIKLNVGDGADFKVAHDA